MFRVVVVEDEPLMRDLLARSLESTGRFSVTAQYETAEQAYALTKLSEIDAVTLDVSLGSGMSGLELASLWRDQRPDLAITVLTSNREPQMLLSFLAFGRTSTTFLHKRSATSLQQLVASIEAAIRGEFHVDDVLTQGLPTPPADERLTPQQRRVMELVAQGWSNARIAGHLTLSTRTIEHTVSAAFRTLGILGDDPAVNPRVYAGLAYLKYLSLEQSTR